MVHDMKRQQVIKDRFTVDRLYINIESVNLLLARDKKDSWKIDKRKAV